MFNIKIISCSIIVSLAGLYSSLAVAAASPRPMRDIDLVTAIYDGHNDALRNFIRAGGDVNKPVSPGGDVNKPVSHDLQYLLNAAAAAGNIEAMRELIKAGANINSQNKDDRYTPLMGAAYNARPDAVMLLLRHEADTRLMDSQNRTALDVARHQLEKKRGSQGALSADQWADYIQKYEDVVWLLSSAAKIPQP